MDATNQKNCGDMFSRKNTSLKFIKYMHVYSPQGIYSMGYVQHTKTTTAYLI